MGPATCIILQKLDVPIYFILKGHLMLHLKGHLRSEVYVCHLEKPGETHTHIYHLKECCKKYREE
jgi:hypothetical protein